MEPTTLTLKIRVDQLDQLTPDWQYALAAVLVRQAALLNSIGPDLDAIHAMLVLGHHGRNVGAWAVADLTPVEQIVLGETCRLCSDLLHDGQPIVTATFGTAAHPEYVHQSCAREIDGR
jgi:hypothetical protein